MTGVNKALLLVASLLATGPAFSADHIVLPDDGTAALRGAYVQFGFALFKQADEGALTVAGTPFAGADFETELGKTVTLEVGTFLRDGFAVSVSGMLPVTTPNIGTGTLSGLGNLGNETIGFYSATAHYHFGDGDAVSPYLGGGLGYMHVFSSEGVAISDLAIRSSFGAVLQAGVDVALTDNVGAFVDVKRYFVSTLATGSLGGAPVAAQTKVDPWVVSAGISLRH